METLESSRVCRLCGKQSGISINIFDKNENHVKKINAVLPIMVHEMDLLPKQMCHRCSYKLEEFHKFYVDCLKTDADLKSQLSWMRKEDSKERVGVPMVHIENIKIKVEPPDYDVYEMDPMVDNVDYINSMSSVTFPVNGVRSKDISKGMTYATYARCDCYCDKADQSNPTVPANFDNRISRCNRIEDVKSEEISSDNESQAVTSTFLANETFGERSTLVKIDEEAKDSRNCESTSSILNLSNSKLTNVPRTAGVRNLRPRKGSVDYVGVKRKLKVSAIPPSNDIIGVKNAQSKASSSATMVAATQIKVEKLDDGLTRILRPRKGTIDYIGPKRKYSRSRSKIQRSQGEEHRSNKTEVRNIARQLKLSPKAMPKLGKNRIQLTIKEEQISDLEDYEFVESTKDQVITSIGDLMVDQIDTLPTDRAASLRNNRVNCSTFNDAQPSSNFSIASTWKLLRSSPKSKLKSREFSMSQVAAINYSPKYLRSQDVYLRSGRIRKLDTMNVSARKLRRSLRNLTQRGKTTAKNLMKAIRDTVTMKNIRGSMKLIDNIKHYCEECNTSFANKELFKLHACYGH